MSTDTPPPLPGKVVPSPPPAPSVPLPHPQGPAATVRPPKAPLVFGIINLCFAALGLSSSITPFLGASPSPVDTPSSSGTSLLLFSVGSLLVLLQVAASVGLIRLREWARKTTVILASLQVLICLGGMAFLTGVLPLPGGGGSLPPAATSTDPTIQKKLEFLDSVFGTLGTLFKVVIVTMLAVSLLYHLLQVILLTRQNVRLACRNRAD